MCDYSLQGIRNRLANVGESLVVHRFHTGSKGLASEKDLKPVPETGVRGWFQAMKMLFATPSSLECAVCIPDGAKLVLSEISPENRREFGLGQMERVTFRQLTAQSTYRDAVEFKNGLKVRLQELDEGTRATVLSVESTEDTVEQVQEFTTSWR